MDASLSEAVDAVVSYMVQQSSAMSYKDDTSAPFTRTKRPNTDIGCLLLLLGIFSISVPQVARSVGGNSGYLRTVTFAPARHCGQLPFAPGPMRVFEEAPAGGVR